VPNNFEGKFRAVRDISISPIEASDQELIIKMMDEPDGVILIRFQFHQPYIVTKS
jgi:hypothetical protein